MNIDNFVTNMAFITDVRKQYDELRSKMGIPHNADVPEDENIDDEADEFEEDGTRGGDATAAAGARYFN